MAPTASVFPPAPAQKSTMISPRFAPSNRATSWLPSSCTSSVPSRKRGCLPRADLSYRRMPQGENGVASAGRPSAWSSARMLSRLAFRALTRKSSGAGQAVLRPKFRMSWSEKSERMVSINHCGSSAAVLRPSENSVLRALSAARKVFSSSSAKPSSRLMLKPRPRTSAASAALRACAAGRRRTAEIFW